MKKSKIECMSLTENLQAIEALGNENVPFPDWHYDVLEERSRLFDSGQTELISLNDFKKQI